MNRVAPVRLDIGLMNEGRGAIIGLQQSGEFFGVPYQREGIIGDHEVLDSVWLQNDRKILYARQGSGDLNYPVHDINRPQNPRGVYPRIEFQNIHYTDKIELTVNEPEPSGSLRHEKVVKSSDILYPESSETIHLGNTEEQTTSMSKAITEGFEASMQEQFGYWTQPAGFQLTETTRKSITEGTNYTSGDTDSIDLTHEARNPFEYPVKANIVASRSIQKMRVSCVVHPDFDYAIRYFPMVGSLENISVVWDSKEQFLDSMHGLAGDDIGVLVSRWKTTRFSSINRTNTANHNLQLSSPDMPVYYSREFDEIHQDVSESFEAVYDQRYHDKYPQADIDRFKEEGLIK